MLPILHQSYWRDEAFSVLLSSKKLEDIFTLTIKDVSPPLYYFLLHFWIKFFGDAEYVTRSLSLFFHFLLVLSCFFLLKHFLRNWKVSLTGALAVLLNPFLLEYAFEARPYTLFAFLVVTATVFYLKRKYFISSLFLALMLLTHNFGIFFLISFVAFWLYENRENLRKKTPQFGLASGVPILVFLGWIRFLWNQWVKVAEGFWIEPKTSAIFVDAFRAFFQGSLDYPSRAMLYNLTLTLAFMGFSYWVARTGKEGTESPFVKSSLLLVFLFLVPFLIVYIISALWVPIYHERFLIPVLPLCIVWIAYSLDGLSKTRPFFSHLIFAFSIAYILFAVQSSEEILRKTTKPAINWGVKQILAKAQSGDVVIPKSNLNFLETKYYVQKSGKDIPVFAYKPSGKIAFYIGSVLFEESEIIVDYPKDKRIWVVTSDGGHYLKKD